MTLDDVRARVDEIRVSAGRGDHERTHSMEDDLYRDVLVAIGAGAGPADVLAGCAVQTQGFAFERWCA